MRKIAPLDVVTWQANVKKVNQGWHVAQMEISALLVNWDA
jgi:hypothetical protein